MKVLSATSVQTFLRKSQFMMEDSLPKIIELENIYGTANSNGFGSAVFYEEMPEGKTVEEIAFKHYRDFIGAKWNDETETGWLSTWKNVYKRRDVEKKDILSELAEISDPAAKQSIPLLTEFVTDAEQCKKALATFFDDPQIAALTINLIGDGAELSGIIVTAVSIENKVCSVVCLMD